MESHPSLDSLYQMLREQIRHEDGLVNHRVTWLLAVEGFLFAISFGLFTVASMPEHTKSDLFKIIGVFGIAFSVSSFFGIQSAHKSLEILRAKWDELPIGTPQEIEAWVSAKAKYPPITYVGKGIVSAWSAAEGTPYLVVTVWVVLLLYFALFA